MRQAQQAVKAAEQALQAASREHQSLKIHLWRTDPVRERKARRLEGARRLQSSAGRFRPTHPALPCAR